MDQMNGQGHLGDAFNNQVLEGYFGCLRDVWFKYKMVCVFEQTWKLCHYGLG